MMLQVPEPVATAEKSTFPECWSPSGSLLRPSARLHRCRAIDGTC